MTREKMTREEEIEVVKRAFEGGLFDKESIAFWRATTTDSEEVVIAALEAAILEKLGVSVDLETFKLHYDSRDCKRARA